MSPIFRKDDADRKMKGDGDIPEGVAAAGRDDEWFLPEDSRAYLAELFQNLDKTVTLEVFTREGENDPYNEFMLKFVRDIARLTKKIVPRYYSLDDTRAAERNVTRSPTLLVQPDEYSIRYSGAPLGEEGRTFMEILLRVSVGQSGMGDLSRKLLAELDEERTVKVFVNPGCPYCPGMVAHAFRAAVERPGSVRAEMIDTTQFPDLAEKYEVGAVPHTDVDDTHSMLGLFPEERFAMELVTRESAEDEFQADYGDAGPEIVRKDLVIIGAGPAGLTAAIYGVRSGLDCVVLEKAVVGGQIAVTPVVENYPGFANIPGKNLVEILAKHAREYAPVHEGESVSEIKIGRQVEVYTNRAVYVARALILATGSTWRKLGAPGEDRYFGNGVNYCASCDGYMYKGKKVVIVGGGNTALTDALHLKTLGVDVSIVHRRDAFRAEKRLQESVEREGIPVLWNREIDEILGDDTRVTGVRLRATDEERTDEVPVDGVFIAIGEDANTDLATQVGLTLDDQGHVAVDRHMRTNIPRIYAAGDLTGGVRQVVTAIGEGSTAALSAFEDIANPYWKK